MLVLTREKDQAIQIGDTIEIVVVSVHENHVKLGIRTSRSVTVDRKEIYEKKAEGKEGGHLSDAG